MNQLRKAKSRNPRRHAVLPRKYIKVVVTYVLLFAIVFSNMSNPLLNVFAGQKKEEFRIHVMNSNGQQKKPWRKETSSRNH